MSGAIATMLGPYRTTESHGTGTQDRFQLSVPFHAFRGPDPARRRQKGAEMARTKPICRAI
jgi:hypothetical protein